MPNGTLSEHVADEMIDLNDLRVFAYVASLASFSLAADALKIHKSSVSRSIARLEMTLETPLVERTTRKVELTRRGTALKERCVEILSHVNETIRYVTATKSEPARYAGTHAGAKIGLPKPSVAAAAAS